MPVDLFKIKPIERPARPVRVSRRPGVSPIPRAKLLPAAVVKTEAKKVLEVETSKAVGEAVGKK